MRVSAWLTRTVATQFIYLVLPCGIQLYPTHNAVYLAQYIWCQLIQHLQRLTVFHHLLWLRGTRDDCRYVWVLQAPRQRELRLGDAEFIGNGLLYVSKL